MPLDIDWVRQQLPERSITYFSTIDSTMQEAARLARSGFPAGTAVVAEEQTAGQGRYGRRWHSEPEAGLYVSLVLRPDLPPDTLPVITLACGLAATEAIARAANLSCDLRWPNDVLLNGLKCAGILVQLEGSAPVVGIGTNVNHSVFPPDLRSVATSLRLAVGAEQSREQLLVHQLQSLDSYCRMLVEGGRQPILELFTRRSSYVWGKRVIVDQGDRVLRGVTEGLDPAGFLILRQDDGTRSLILAGGVRPA